MNVCRRSLIAGSIVLVLLIGACEEPSGSHRDRETSVAAMAAQWHEDLERQLLLNPCGHRKIQRPFINVTGSLTMAARRNTAVRLYLTRNLTYADSMYAVENCTVIRRGRLLNATRFSLGLLPEGRYVIAVHGRSFEEGQQGFPVLDKVRRHNLTVHQKFVGGSAENSIAVFSIRPVEEGGANGSERKE